MALTLVIRADASLEIGVGHVMRCATLAEHLRLVDADITFVCRPQPGDLIDWLRSKNFVVHELPNEVATMAQDAEQTAEILEKNSPAKLDWLVVDHYGLDREWEQRLRPHAQKILVIDDLADREHDCDLLLDQNFHADMARRYRGRVPGTCRLLLGPAYALLRQEFIAARRALPERDGVVRRLLISFGGTDPTNESGKALEALRVLGRDDLAVDIVLGTGNPRRTMIEREAAALPGVQCHVGVENMADFMARADLALGAAGTTTWERCCLGLPSLVVSVAENQVLSARSLAESGYLIYLGFAQETTAADIAGGLGVLLHNRPWMKFLGQASAALVDGRGVARVAYSMMPPQISLRPAQAADSDAIWRWRNAEETRRHAFDDRPIPQDVHDRWFESALHDPARALLIGVHQGQAIGVLRYDITGDRATVSVYLLPGLYGRGFGSSLLEAGSRWMLENHPGVGVLRAEVKVANEASSGAFLKAGFLSYANIYQMELKP